MIDVPLHEIMKLTAKPYCHDKKTEWRYSLNSSFHEGETLRMSAVLTLSLPTFTLPNVVTFPSRNGGGRGERRGGKGVGFNEEEGLMRMRMRMMKKATATATMVMMYQLQADHELHKSGCTVDPKNPAAAKES